MGLLDDAIREHLELKRQHGADPDEVTRQEQEALGAARRAEFAKPEGQASEEAEAAPPEAPEEPAAEEPVAAPEEPAAEVEEAAPEPVAANEREPFDVESLEPSPEPAPEAQAPKPAADEEPWLEDEHDEVPAGESLDHPRTEESEPSEDVLEETPDFLQETPEHDRLWFEQRPPRNFDWDK
jgi:hypothetical protein